MTRDTLKESLVQGAVLSGPKFNEPMRVINEPRRGGNYIIVDLVGTRTPSYLGGFVLSEEDLQSVIIEDPRMGFSGVPQLFQLGGGKASRKQ
jgi:hypothetical protein